METTAARNDWVSIDYLFAFVNTLLLRKGSSALSDSMGTCGKRQKTIPAGTPIFQYCGTPIFQYCGRCFAEGKEHSAPPSQCRLGNKVSPLFSKTTFCLRCDNLLQNSGTQKHFTGDCKHKEWSKQLQLCPICAGNHRQSFEFRRSITEMYEFVFYSLQRNTKLRSAACEYLSFQVPGQKQKAWDEHGTIDGFFEWLMTRSSEDPSKTNFYALFKYVEKWGKEKGPLVQWSRSIYEQ